MSGRVIKGTIHNTRVETDYTNKDELNAIFVVTTDEEGDVKCRHKCHGKHEDRTAEVFALLELDYPDDIAVLTEPMNPTIGKEVDVYVDTYEGHLFGKINTGHEGGGRPLDAETVAAKLAAKKGGSNVPF